MERKRPAPRLAPLSPPSLGAVGEMLAGSGAQSFDAPRGARLAIAGRPQETTFLIAEGVVAIIAHAPGGATVEAGLIGPGGLVGHAAALGAPVSNVDATALSAARGYAVRTADFVRLAAERPNLRRALTDYGLARMAEVERLCVCSANHSIEQRLARWFASAAVLAGERPIEITHRQLSDLFGVRRASVTVSLHLLEGEQAVRCRRGRVEIRDMARLRAASCGCHWTAPGDAG